MSTHTTENIDRLLRTDPLSDAEKLTGQSYKDDEQTMVLGFGLAMLHNQVKEAALRSASDSYFNMTFAEQMDLFLDMGFEEVYRETFAGRYGEDTYVILWHADGILATCESHDGTHRNDAKVYYNFREADGHYPGYSLTSGGHMNGDVWVGDHNAREGIRHNLNALREAGEFLPQWIERPLLWLLNYTESDGEYDYDAINARKIAQFPEHVRLAITPEAQSKGAES